MAATEAARAEIQRERLEQSRAPQHPGGETVDGGRRLHPLSDTVEAVEVDGERLLRCTVCHHRFGDYSDDYKRAAVLRERPLREASPVDRLVGEDIVLREYCCPGCATLVAADVQLRGDPIMDESRLGFAPRVTLATAPAGGDQG
jgi:N-methylhydantoinase B